jgi:hypothetical protein
MAAVYLISLALAVLPFLEPLSAQAPTPAATTNAPPTAPADQQPVTPAPAVAKPADGKPADAALSPGSLGTVASAQAKVRCFGSDTSPLFEDVLPQGTVVGVGPAVAGFRRISLPLGVVGYVHKKFAVEVDGKVQTKGRAVAFRYRPKTGEAPVSTLAEATELQVIGEKTDEKTGDQWWIVRNPAAEAWLAEAEVQVVADPPEALRALQQEQQKPAQAQLEGWRQQQVDKLAKAQKEQEQMHALAGIGDELGAEKRKPVEQQTLASYEALGQKLDALAVEIAADSKLQDTVKSLRRNIDDRKFVLEATSLVKSEPVPVKDLTPVTPQPPDALGRFNTIGWLRWEKGLVGPGRYVIEKGGQRLFLVQCSNGRYDLSMFVDKEVGLVGPSRRPASDSLRLLDIEKIEILGL